MKAFAAFLLVMGLVSSGCTTTLRLTRPGPPEGTFGGARTLSVSTVTAGKTAGNAVLQGLILAEVPITINAEALVKERIVARLQRLGYSVCGDKPCGDGAMQVALTESEVAAALSSAGLRATSRLRVNVKVRAADGSEPYDFDFWDSRSGSVAEAPMLVEACADTVANRFERTLLPSQQVSRLPLEDGGALSGGVNLLLAGSYLNATSYFEDLTRRDPQLDGAWYDLGVAYEAQGLWPQAAAAYEHAAMLKRSKTYLDAVETARAMTAAVPASPSNPANAPLRN